MSVVDVHCGHVYFVPFIEPKPSQNITEFELLY